MNCILFLCVCVCVLRRKPQHTWFYLKCLFLSFLSTILPERISVVLLWLLDLINTGTCDSTETKKNTSFVQGKILCYLCQIIPLRKFNLLNFCWTIALVSSYSTFSPQNNPDLGCNPLLLSCYVAFTAIYTVCGRNYSAFKGRRKLLSEKISHIRHV